MRRNEQQRIIAVVQALAAHTGSAGKAWTHR
jgi:hypothetical protein